MEEEEEEKGEGLRLLGKGRGGDVVVRKCEEPVVKVGFRGHGEWQCETYSCCYCTD